MLRRSNKVLAAFGEDLGILRPHMHDLIIPAGEIIFEPGRDIRHVYFLHQGAVSKLSVFADGSEIESALIGREGAIGASSAFGQRESVTRDVCHVEAQASLIEAARLREACLASPRIREMVGRYLIWKTNCAIRSGACNARHSVEQRLCRWLLTGADVLERSEITLPQDVLAKMLGAQRTSVNPILQTLRSAGVLALGRSRLRILDRPRLMERACECYEAMRRDAARLLDVDEPMPAWDALDFDRGGKKF